MMKSVSHLAFIVAVSATIVSASSAQEFLDKQELSVPQRCALKLTQEPVAAKVKLSSAQLKAVQQAEKSYLEESKKISEEKTPKISDQEMCDKKFANACLNALNPDQKHTLLQIGIPEIGIQALLDPAIITRLALTSAQVQKIGKINASFAKKEEDLSAMIADALLAIPEPKAGADQSAYEQKRQQTSKMYDGERQKVAHEKVIAEKKILAALTPDQRAKWQDLAGIPKK